MTDPLKWALSTKGWFSITTKDQVVHVCLSKVRDITEFRKTPERKAFLRITYDDGTSIKINGQIGLDLGGILFR